MKELTSVEEFKEALEANDQIVLFKHSLTCPISSEGKGQVEKFDESHDVPTFIIHIQNNRELSDYVAEHFNIKHESPQLFYIKNGQVDFHASHFDITNEKIEQAVQ